ncbi:MAG TPA: hypothetical protein DHV67_07770 [Gallionella sp.]|nr:hypothetical protein [Gallionella sp.]
MQHTRLLLLLAALSFIPTLFFYSVGEEGIYTISTMEMWQSRNWFIETMYGINLQRPPLMNWLGVGIANLLGWTHVLHSIRLLSIAATLGMAAWLYWLSARLFADRSFAAFAALGCLAMADLALYRGWLAYTDPLFAFFTFAAMASLWVAALEKHKGWLLASVLLVSCALLTKAFTAYVFYATVGFVLLWRQETRRFLLSPAALLILFSALIVPYLWFSSIPQAGGQSGSMLNEIVRKLAIEGGAFAYLNKLLTFPLEVAFRLSPVVLLAVYLLLRKRMVDEETRPQYFQAAAWMTALGFLPYWLSPQSSIRYLLPLYPFIALIAARLIWRAGTAAQSLALRWFTGLLVFKLLFGVLLYPYYQSHFRGENYVTAAHEIAAQTANFPLYSNDPRSITENIVSEIDRLNMPNRLVFAPPPHWDNGFLLAMEIETDSQVFSKLRVANDDLYLLCRGRACNVPRSLTRDSF